MERDSDSMVRWDECVAEMAKKLYCKTFLTHFFFTVADPGINTSAYTQPTILLQQSLMRYKLEYGKKEWEREKRERLTKNLS